MQSDAVRVSMYNVGFGDCFLLRFPGANRDHTVLVDCGSIKEGKAGGTEAIVRQIIQDITFEGVPTLDVVAMSHRHKDHVSGFGDAAWNDVDVGEVWLPWIEDPNDLEARRILHEMASFALGLKEEAVALQRFEAAERELVDHVIENSLMLSNERSMVTLHRGFKGGTRTKRRFLARSDDPLPTELLPTVTVHVLGPSRDEDVIREMNPPSTEAFLRACGNLAGNEDECLPFEPGPWLASEPTDDLKDMLRRLAHESALLGAVALEKAVNNTSLMLVFEIGQAVLFFPGDSQWGSWAINLDDPARRELLARTTFYKVGHHGSHNATPVSFVKEVLNQPGGPASDVWAAASVTPHGRFTEIPKPDLLQQLEAKIALPRHVIRSDQPPPKNHWPQGFSVNRRNNKVMRIDFELPTV